MLLIGLLRAQCTNPRVRRDWTQLSAADRAAYTVKTINETALQRLYERPPGNLNGDPTQWNYEQFAQVHDASNVANHGKPAFFIWHREFVYQFERALQTINPSITVPYWDWRLDSQNPFAAAVFQTFGRNGEGVENCVKTGVAGNWTFSPGKTECVKRCFSNGVWYSPESVANLLSNSLNFNSVRNNIENSPHAVVHTSIGGSCGQMNTMRSPIDPVLIINHRFSGFIILWWISYLLLGSIYVQNSRLTTVY